MNIVLTGITTTGTPHLGNYVGAIRPAIAASRRADVESFYFLADYHALVKCDDPARVQQSTLEIAASWLALRARSGARSFFYRQSDIPEIPELTWLLTCVTGKGLLNRAHAYKAAVDQNTGSRRGRRRRHHRGPLHVSGADGRRHPDVQRARGAGRARPGAAHRDGARHRAALQPSSTAKTTSCCPKRASRKTSRRCPALDGRKMSKSYDNTIPLLLPAQGAAASRSSASSPIRARRASRRIPRTRTLFAIYQAFASADETRSDAPGFADGIALGRCEAELFERIDAELAPARAQYERLIASPQEIERHLRAGAEKARALCKPFIAEIRTRVGIRRLAR